MDALPRRTSAVGVMWRKQTVLDLSQRAVGGEWFVFKYVECRAGDLAALQCVDERGLINNVPARRIYEVSSGSHQVQLRTIDQVIRTSIEIAVQGDDIRRLQ